MLAHDYAQALYELGSKAEHLKPLRDLLTRRGHQKLLSSILSEYQKIALAKERLVAHKTESPEQARTRTLLELYRTLTK